MDPGDYSYGYHVAVVVFPDGRDEPVDPCFSDLFTCAACKVEGDALYEVLSCELAGEPVSFLFIFAGQYWFVHKIVTEDRGAFGTGFCDRLPEDGLRVPALCLIHLVVPFRDVFFMVAAEAGDIEVKACLLGEFDEFGELGEGGLVGLGRRLHEFSGL